MRKFLTQRKIPSGRAGALTFLAILLSCLLLSACGTTGGEQTQSAPPAVSQLPDEPLTRILSLELPSSRYSAHFSLAEEKLLQFDWMGIENALSTIAHASVTDQQYLDYFKARVLYIQGHQIRAAAQLNRLGALTANSGLHYKVLNFQHLAFSLAGDHFESAKACDQLLKIVGDGIEQDSLRRKLWRELSRLSPTQIESALNTDIDQQLRGALELAQIAAATNSSADNSLALRHWLASHPGDTLAGGMGYLLAEHNTANKVALLLPLTGRLAPAAQAVRDGYLASYYLARASGERPVEIYILDITAYNSAAEAYRDAIARGAELVIGPLSKRAVEELGQLSHRPVPVLTLNRADTPLPNGTTALVQLALAPEDEASQIAALAFGQGSRRALIIRPAGPWGNKMEQALRQAWTAQGATVASTATYAAQENYSSTISAALNIPASEQRARQVRSMLATNVEFTARRRADLDAVALLGKNAIEARSLKPLLDYHYAADLPVYATSHIYRGIPDSRDMDLSGIKLLETPWLLGANPGVRVAIAAGGTGSDNYTRLNALGADAYLLQTKFNQLQAGEDMLIRGNTGLLSLTPQLHIQRELQAAIFDGSLLIAQ